MPIKIIKSKQIDEIFSEIKKNTPIIIYKNFFNINDCNKIKRLCHKNFSIKINRKRLKNKFLNFASLDVLPSNTRTKRILRSFELSDFLIRKNKKIQKLLNFQNKVLKLKNNEKIFRKVQVIYYPKGGGFFEKHSHPRYPTNYGFIITLSEKNKEFNQGVTNFEINKRNYSLEKYNITKGDLILFRFDLPHFVTPCDPGDDLKFDMKGRWTLVLPVYHERF